MPNTKIKVSYGCKVNLDTKSAKTVTMQSVFDGILDEKNFLLYNELICDILIPHLFKQISSYSSFESNQTANN